MWCGFVLFYFGLENLFEVFLKTRKERKKRREYLPVNRRAAGLPLCASD
jgi:hypothetical protein